MSLNVLVILHFVRSRFRCSCFRATLLTVLRTVYPIGRISSGLCSVLGSVSRKPRKVFGPVKPFLNHLYLKTEKCIRLKLLV